LAPRKVWIATDPQSIAALEQRVNLFEQQSHENRQRVAPLAVRLRPQTLDDFVGQQHFLGDGKLLRRMLQANRLTSAIFFGPPGTGKTTLAHIIARVVDAHFEHVNAASTTVKEVRALLDTARQRVETGGEKTVLFVDELHRFNRSQQDVLLDDVEQGLVILLGATTENPFFSIRTPLLSRSQIFQFNPLSIDDVETVLRRALSDSSAGFGGQTITASDAAIRQLAIAADGDARRALTALEVAVLSQRANSDSAEPIIVDEALAAESIQRKVIRYDRDGDEHYDTASALIKSIRGSDPDAAVYWLARMLEAGEDPRFVARRLVISAAEDIGNADPMGLLLAQAAADATSFVGLPECKLPLAQAAIYLSCAEKSNACTLAIKAADQDVRTGQSVPIPKHLRDASYNGAKALGHGDGYRYPHDCDNGIAEQEYLGVDRTYYTPVDRGVESQLLKYLAKAKKMRHTGPPSDTVDPTTTP